jgi:NAD(P)-dependent dehydrogenase (short-subunit alcohol dehydrogenase family)
MADQKVWLITGAGRGMGVDIARAALAAGNAVVATGRNPAAVTQAAEWLEAPPCLRQHEAGGVNKGTRP